MLPTDLILYKICPPWKLPCVLQVEHLLRGFAYHRTPEFCHPCVRRAIHYERKGGFIATRRDATRPDRNRAQSGSYKLLDDATPKRTQTSGAVGSLITLLNSSRKCLIIAFTSTWMCLRLFDRCNAHVSSSRGTACAACVDARSANQP